MYARAFLFLTLPNLTVVYAYIHISAGECILKTSEEAGESGAVYTGGTRPGDALSPCR